MIGKSGEPPQALAWFESENASAEDAAAARASVEELIATGIAEQAATRDEVARILAELESTLAPRIEEMFEAGGHDYAAMKKHSADFFVLAEEGIKKERGLSPQELSQWEQDVLSAVEPEIAAARKAIAHVLTGSRTSTLAWPGLLVFKRREGADVSKGAIEPCSGELLR